MDRELVRTCSAEQAAVLVQVEGQVVQVGPNLVRIHPLTGRRPIDPFGASRYIARVELLDCESRVGAAGQNATDVISRLFGVYLELPSVNLTQPIPIADRLRF